MIERVDTTVLTGAAAPESRRTDSTQGFIGLTTSDFTNMQEGLKPPVPSEEGTT